MMMRYSINDKIPGGFRLSRVDYTELESIQMLQHEVHALIKETKEFESQYRTIASYYESIMGNLR